MGATTGSKHEKENGTIAYDSALWLSGNATNPSETITTSNATKAGTALAPNRVYLAELRVGGAVTGTSPTLDITVQDSVTGSTSWQTIATFAQVTTTMSGVTNPENTAAAARGAALVRAFRVTDARPYVHIGVTAGGTTPSFSDVTVRVIPLDLQNN